MPLLNVPVWAPIENAGQFYCCRLRLILLLPCHDGPPTSARERQSLSQCDKGRTKTSFKTKQCRIHRDITGCDSIIVFARLARGLKVKEWMFVYENVLHSTFWLLKAAACVNKFALNCVLFLVSCVSWWMSLLFKWNWHFNDEGVFVEGSLQSCQSCHRQQTRTFIQCLSQCWEQLYFLNIDWQEQKCTRMCTTASCQQDCAYSSYLTGKWVQKLFKLITVNSPAESFRQKQLLLLLIYVRRVVTCSLTFRMPQKDFLLVLINSTFGQFFVN